MTFQIRLDPNYFYLDSSLRQVPLRCDGSVMGKLEIEGSLVRDSLEAVTRHFIPFLVLAQHETTRSLPDMTCFCFYQLYRDGSSWVEPVPN